MTTCNEPKTEKKQTETETETDRDRDWHCIWYACNTKKKPCNGIWQVARAAQLMSVAVAVAVALAVAVVR